MGWYPNFWGGDTAQMGLWDGNGSEGKWRELRWVGSWEALAHTIQGRSGWRIMIKPPDWFEDLRKIGPNHRVRSAKGGKTLYFPHSRMMRRNMLMVVSVGRWSRVPWIISEYPGVYYALGQQKVSRCLWGSRRVSHISSCRFSRDPGGAPGKAMDSRMRKDTGGLCGWLASQWAEVCSSNGGGATRDQMLLGTHLNSYVTPWHTKSGIPNQLNLSPHLCGLEIEVNIKCRNKSVFCTPDCAYFGHFNDLWKSGYKTCFWDLKNWNKGV